MSPSHKRSRETAEQTTPTDTTRTGERGKVHLWENAQSLLSAYTICGQKDLPLLDAHVILHYQERNLILTLRTGWRKRQ